VEQHQDITQTAEGGIFSLLLALAVFWIAKRNRFFNLPPPSRYLPVTFSQTLGAFVIYLLFAFLVLPVVLLFVSYGVTGDIRGVKKLPHIWLGWGQVGALWVLFFLLVFYCFLITPSARRFIFWGEGERSGARFFKGIGMGVVACAVSYPFVLIVSFIASRISLWIWGETEVEQSAVKHLKTTMGNPYLFGFMAFAVIALVPFLEELLFRGFLQNLFKRHFGRRWAIALSAVIFALAHFSYGQGIGNFQLLLSLIVLAFFLAFIYERERTLWASIGLHMTFNAFNVLMMVLSYMFTSAEPITHLFLPR
jgi:uncharacterized protein